ncbi:hypothetical protein Asulf_00950 [Archaeoglobus sulfaticallidus PM70-1]|uniref:Uncharacterized protein n=1 Tax=Archaeoglobus sulfaticallidus PM70-1 TaxID=387631 RepID=N0BBH8_9EURY|nr:hypothetical protein [Archaeoglobus sulfaticallidus]AGK60954.1 hypothetical protein Asulf_00950 [Archaeoglobus sulfaticallidus PM70-1]
MRKIAIVIVFFIICNVAFAAEVNQTKLSDKDVLKKVKAKLGIKEFPQPTIETNHTVVYVLFRFGAWDRVAYNNTKAVAPLYIYAYSKSLPVKVIYWTESKKLNGTLQGSWGLLGTIGQKGMKDTIYLKIEVDGEVYTYKIPLVKSIKEKKEEEGVLTFKKEVIERHAQVAIVLAVFAIAVAYVLKRKTLLISPFNFINLGFVIGLTAVLAYYLEYIRTDSTFWLAFVFTASEILSYQLFTAGRKVWFMQILPSVREILIEEGVLYKIEKGMAYARQSVDEAIKRLKGEHILVEDKEIKKPGVLSEDKFFKVIFNEFDIADSLIVFDAKIRRKRVDYERNSD